MPLSDAWCGADTCPAGAVACLCRELFANCYELQPTFRQLGLGLGLKYRNFLGEDLVSCRLKGIGLCCGMANAPCTCKSLSQGGRRAAHPLHPGAGRFIAGTAPCEPLNA